MTQVLQDGSNQWNTPWQASGLAVYDAKGTLVAHTGITGNRTMPGEQLERMATMIAEAVNACSATSNEPVTLRHIAAIANNTRFAAEDRIEIIQKLLAGAAVQPNEQAPSKEQRFDFRVEVAWLKWDLPEGIGERPATSAEMYMWAEIERLDKALTSSRDETARACQEYRELIEKHTQLLRASNEPPAGLDAAIATTKDVKLFCDVRVGAGTFKRGIPVATLLMSIRNHIGYAEQQPGYPFTDGYLDRASPPPEDGWVIYYEDRDEPAEHFYGHGAEDAARRRFEQRSMAWTCRLFRCIAKSGYGPTPTKGEG